LWGRNRKLAVASTQNSYLLESVLNFKQKNYLFQRFELVDKDELFADLGAPPSPELAGAQRIGAYTFGGVRDLLHNHTGQIGLGAGVTFYSKPDILNPLWGTNPVSFNVFLRFRPGSAEPKH